MTNIYNNQDAIQTAISKAGGISYPSCCNWSSSEISSDYAWYSSFNYSYGLYDYTGCKDYYHFNFAHYVRPVLEF